MIGAILVAAATATGQAPVEVREWASLNHDFVCNLHDLRGQAIHLEGSARETVNEGADRSQTEGEFRFRSSDPKWRFMSGATKTTGGMLLQSHTLHFDNIDDPADAGFKPYSLQLTFANRIDGLKGPYGYAVIRDQSVNADRVNLGSDHPITAIGSCMMTPKTGVTG
jgi:hypothetical protein